jgi:hypothetical protein
VAEGVHRVDASGAPGWDVAGNQSGGDQDQGCDGEGERVEGADLE